MKPQKGKKSDKAPEQRKPIQSVAAVCGDSEVDNRVCSMQAKCEPRCNDLERAGEPSAWHGILTYWVTMMDGERRICGGESPARDPSNDMNLGDMPYQLISCKACCRSNVVECMGIFPLKC